MIIGESFLWLHFPKAAGTTTTYVLLDNFGSDKSISFDETGEDEPIWPPIWHETIKEREERTGISLKGKDILANIRRLPAYVASRIRYSEVHNPDNPHTKAHLLAGRFVEHNGWESTPDWLLQHYEVQNVKHWIRTENLEEDFIAVFGNYLDLNGKNLSALSQKINSTNYNESLTNLFTRDEMTELYRKNPIWSVFEHRVYGNLLYEEIY